MKRIIRFFTKGCIGFVLLSILWVFLYKWIAVPITPLMIIRQMNTKTQSPIQHEWVPLSKISKNLQLAVICSEDQQFVTHSGFDTEAIEKAIAAHKLGKRLRGASTISQQTAKNVFLWPQRSWIRKGLESYFTFLIEYFWSKEHILEVYLNNIEMGSGVYGAQAASKFWFNKNAANLTKAEASAIAAILPNPQKFMANPATKYIQKRKEWIIKQMKNYGILVF